MATYIVLPHLNQASMDTAQTDDQDLLAELGVQRAATLFPNRDAAITVSSSLYLTDTVGALQQRTTSRDGVQFLDALNAYLVHDLTPEERQNIEGEVDILENIQIGVVPPTDVATEEDGPWHLKRVNINEAQDQALTGQGVRIGILDTGIDATHSEFAGKHISFMEFDTSGFPVSTTPRDAGDHGTHVAGIATGTTCGVAPRADLAVAAVLTKLNVDGQLTGHLAQILAGYNWLVHQNHSPAGAISKCPVVNASLGAPGFHNFLYSSVHMQLATLQTSLMVATIGNSGHQGVDHHGSPGNYDITVGVGAVDASGIVAPFSDWGLETTHMAFKPDLCAPGVAIRSATPGGGFKWKSGTSMASPAASGAAALLVQKYPSLARKPSGLKAALVKLVDSSTVNNPANHSSGYSRIGSGMLDLTGI